MAGVLSSKESWEGLSEGFCRTALGYAWLDWSRRSTADGEADGEIDEKDCRRRVLIAGMGAGGIMVGKGRWWEVGSLAGEGLLALCGLGVCLEGWMSFFEIKF